MLGLFNGCLAIGVIGIVSMAFLAFGHMQDAGHAGHAHDAGGHDAGGVHHDAGLHHDVGVHHDAGAHHDAGVHHDAGAHHDAGHAHDAHDNQHEGHHVAEAVIRNPFWMLPSPVMIFSMLIGFGLVGGIAEGHTGYWWAIALGIAGAFAFERGLVRPFWKLIFSFASTPSESLQGTLGHRAVAVTAFDASGRGLVRLLMDGQDRDVLARLMPGEPLGGVRKGEILFVEKVNDADSSVVVSRPQSLPGSGAAER